MSCDIIGTIRGKYWIQRATEMRTIRAALLRIGGLFNKHRRDRDLAAELESHLQLHIDDNLRACMTPEEGRRQALIKLGGRRWDDLSGSTATLR